MAYIYVEEPEDGVEYADVVSAEDYNTIRGELEEASRMRDEAITQIEQVSKDYEELRTKYATRFLTNAEQIKADQEHDIKRDGTPTTYDELFSNKEGM